MGITVDEKSGLVELDGREIGWVAKVEFPHQRNGQVWIEERWEARLPHQVLVNDPLSFPTFEQKDEALAWLAAH